MKPKHKSTRSAKRQSFRSSLNNTKTTMVTKCKNGKHSRVTGGTPIRKTRRFLKNSRVQKRKSINKAMKDTVINHVRKLLGDDSIEDYTGYADDINLIQDLNLLILSSSQEEYETYCDSIRKEYATLSDSSYNGMRLKILETFLTIPAIYQTPAYFSKFENKARENIKNEIERLKISK